MNAFYAFIKSLPKLHLYVLLYKWKNIEMEVSPRNQDTVDDTFQREYKFTMEAVISGRTSHNLLYTAKISRDQRKQWRGFLWRELYYESQS